MKHLIILFIFSFSLVGFSQNDSFYSNAMESAVDSMSAVKEGEGYKNSAREFALISFQHPDKWQPYYYTALAYNLYSFQVDSVMKDSMLNTAERYVNRAAEIAPNESEIAVLQAFILQARIQVDPSIRGYEYGHKAIELLRETLDQNPYNPRALYLLGSMTYYMPEGLGGDLQQAKRYLQRAVKAYSTFEAPGPHWPSWGEGNAKRLLKKCNIKIQEKEAEVKPPR